MLRFASRDGVLLERQGVVAEARLTTVLQRGIRRRSSSMFSRPPP